MPQRPHLTDAERIVELYQRHANAWAEARLREADLYERGWLDRFRALLPIAGSVLDIGCGFGKPISEYFVKCGHAVTGIDSSPPMIEMFRQNLPGQQALVADMRNLALGKVFSGILAWDSFFHLTPAGQRNMFPIFRAHAAPGAALMFTSGASHGEVIGSLEDDPLYHASLNPAEYRKLLGESGFEVIAHIAEDADCRGRTVWLAQQR